MHFPMWLRGYMAWPIRSIPIRLQGGPAADAKWSFAAAPRRYRSGGYESERFLTIQRLVHAGDVFWDVGAHFGYATLVAGRIVGPGGAVVCVEPSAYNRWFLQKHLQWNGINATVLPYAIGDQDDVAVRFGGEHTSTTFRIGQGFETATLRTLPSLLAEHRLPPPTVLKLDIEGNESKALRAAAELLEPGMALIVSVHSSDNYEDCVELLRTRGFTVLEAREIGDYRAVRGREWRRDPDLLAFGSARVWQRSDFEASFVDASVL